MRAFFWLWAMALLLCLVTDSAVYWIARSRLSLSLDLALDAALIGSINEDDLIHGRQLARADQAEAWANAILKKNLSGMLAQSASLNFWLTQDKDCVVAKGQVKSRVPFLSGALAGKGSREISVSRELSYQGRYK